jgi:hypothetical protein
VRVVSEEALANVHLSAIAPQKLAESLPPGVPPVLAKEAYLLSLIESKVVLSSTSPTGFAAGAATLSQLIQPGTLQRCEIVDWPALAFRAVLLDLARGPVYSVPALKRRIKDFAGLKLNAVLLYSEASFALPSEKFSAGQGGLSETDISDLATFGRALGVAVVPLQQSFAHSRRLIQALGRPDLGVAGYRHTIDVRKPTALDFLTRMHEDVARMFASPIQHIGGDEVNLSALHPDGGRAYAKVVASLTDALRLRGVRTMIWGDVALKDRDVFRHLPNDIIVAHWDYRVRESYAPPLRRLREQGFDVVGVAGSHSWNRPVADLNSAFANILGMASDVERERGFGLITTAWNDDGAALPYAAAYSLAFGAAAAWEGDDGSLERFRRSIDAVLFKGRPSHVVALAEELANLEIPLRLTGRSLRRMASEPAAYRDPCEPVITHVESSWHAVRRRARSVRDALLIEMTTARGGHVILDELVYASKFIDLWVSVELLATRCGRIRPPGSPVSVEGEVVEELTRLYRRVALMEADYQRLWLNGYRPSGLTHALRQFERLRARVASVGLRSRSSPNQPGARH